MADIFFVCVRKDIPRTEALAAMFHASGFSIGDLPSTDAALRLNGAGILVWSQASMQSPQFHAGAERVIRAGRAVFASLTKSPRPSSLGAAPAFDLSRWNGDPRDSSVDPLFDAVEKMAIDLRAQIEHWQTISDSRNASLFVDYLDRYGPSGAFCEAAEFRLQQLAASEPRTQPRVSQDVVEISSSPSASHAAPGWDESMRRTASLLDASPMIAPLGASKRVETRVRSDPLGRVKRKRSARRKITLFPFLAGAALAGAVYYGGSGELNSMYGALDELNITPRHVVPLPPPVAVGGAVRLEEPASAPGSEALPQLRVEFRDVVHPNEPAPAESVDAPGRRASLAAPQGEARRNAAPASTARAERSAPPIVSINARQGPAVRTPLGRLSNAAQDADAPPAASPVPTTTNAPDLEQADTDWYAGAESTADPAPNAEAAGSPLLRSTTPERRRARRR